VLVAGGANPALIAVGPTETSDPGLVSNDLAIAGTRLPEALARQLYVGYVAHFLLVEIGGLVPWSFTGYDDTTLGSSS
jgi:hypothetical protein